VQPIAVTHPLSGRKALYVNRLMTAWIEGMAPDESDRLLEELYEASEDPAIRYEHVWRKGDLMMWDNWCSIHARTDFPATERRMLRRCTILGQALHE
jgi:taurine dioxygenase